MSCGDAKLRSWEDWLWASQANARKGRPGMCVGHGLSCQIDDQGLCVSKHTSDARCCRYWDDERELTRDEAVARLDEAAHGG